MVPAAVLRAYGWEGCAVRGATSGLINQTYLVSDAGGTFAVLQQLHPVFGASVNIDLEAVTQHIAARGLQTPVLVRTTSDERCVEDAGKVWRAITYVRGRTFDKVPTTDAARSAGSLVGRFHRAMADFEHTFVHVRAGVHDTAAHIAKLTALRQSNSIDGVDQLADEILAAASVLPDFSKLPRRPCHGDLKISNVLFDDASHDAICLIDLDTNALQYVAHELGDALRSWCNPHAEDVERPHVSMDVLTAAMHGYASAAGGLLTQAEQTSIADGFMTIPIELASRFCADAYEDCYFGWDPQRYASRRDHNVARATSQLLLGQEVRRLRPEIGDVLQRAFNAR